VCVCECVCACRYKPDILVLVECMYVQLSNTCLSRLVRFERGKLRGKGKVSIEDLHSGLIETGDACMHARYALP
jgi:hypothetical protein